MRNASVLIAALEIVEERLTEPMTAEELAKACYSSCSGLQKLFRYAFRCSVSDYVTKRRLSRASRELVTTGKSIMEIALDYQYGSPEAFSRAFKRFWGISPNEFRKTRRFTELAPKRMIVEATNGGIVMNWRRTVDVSDLYDEFRKLTGTYVLSVDIRRMECINRTYGRAMGDLVIAEAAARLEKAMGDDMLMFRVGGDEFAVITRSMDSVEAEKLAWEIVSRNGEMVRSGDEGVPLELRIGVGKIPEKMVKYRQALELMENAVQLARDSEVDVAVYGG